MIPHILRSLLPRTFDALSPSRLWLGGAWNFASLMPELSKQTAGAWLLALWPIVSVFWCYATIPFCSSNDGHFSLLFFIFILLLSLMGPLWCAR